MKNFLLAISLFASSSVVADNHTEAAQAHIKATHLDQVFSITKDNVLQRLEAYGEQLRNSPKVKGNQEAIKLTDEYVLFVKQQAEAVYTWKTVEEKYVAALKATYTEQELLEINAWLSTEVGKSYIAKQHQFMLKTIDVGTYATQLFQQRIAEREREYASKLSALSTSK